MKTKMMFLAMTAAFGAAGGQGFAESGLPGQMKWMSYPTDSSGYAQAVAISTMLKETHGTRVAVLPGQNDTARLAPVRGGQADYCMCGIAAYFATEGVTDFASPDWGPMPLRLILSKVDGSGVGFATRGDAGITTAADLAGKRVPDVRAAAALNIPMGSVLAFGGLSRDDVEIVPYSGFSASWDGVINGQSDVAFATTLTPKSAQLASGPSGIHWIPLPHDDAEGWARLQEKAPYISQRVVTRASGMAEGESFEGAGYPYPFLVTSERIADGEAYALTKSMVENFDAYKDAAPGAAGWALEVQEFKWVIPFHPGAIRYFEEAGIWTEDMAAHNDALLAREKVLHDAWAALDKDAAGEGDAFKAAWMEARNAALGAAGLPLVFE